MISTASDLRTPDTPRRTWNLALAFQEVFTAIVRLRFNSQNITDAEQFRRHLKQALQMAQQDARAQGYSNDDVQLAMFAVIAFIDESILNANNPALADWARLTLQEELYGGHVAGETFFRSLQTVLDRPESTSTIDLLEIYNTCLLLGYRGRYGAGSAGELSSIKASVRDKMGRLRGTNLVLSPRFGIPAERPRPLRRDAWVRRLEIVAVCLFLAGVLCFGGSKLLLQSNTSSLRALTVQNR